MFQVTACAGRLFELLDGILRGRVAPDVVVAGRAFGIPNALKESRVALLTLSGDVGVAAADRPRRPGQLRRSPKDRNEQAEDQDQTDGRPRQRPPRQRTGFDADPRARIEGRTLVVDMDDLPVLERGVEPRVGLEDPQLPGPDPDHVADLEAPACRDEPVHVHSLARCGLDVEASIALANRRLVQRDRQALE